MRGRLEPHSCEEISLKRLGVIETDTFEEGKIKVNGVIEGPWGNGLSLIVLKGLIYQLI